MIERDEEFEAASIERIAAPLRAPESLDATFEARVMTAVRASTPPRRPAPRHWLLEPRPWRLSPVAATALAAGFAVLVAGVTLLAGTFVRGGIQQVATVSVPRAGGAPVQDTIKVVQFVLVAPHAAEVALVGDFNDWDERATPLRPVSDDVWSVAVPLTPGRHQYAFVVDGTRWVADPTAPRAIEDSFGKPNSVITVGESTS